MKSSQAEVQSWDWYPCSAQILNYNSLTGKALQLVPDTPLLINDNSYDLTLSLNLTKNFNHSPEIGWNWHKSWNLPDVICFLKPNDDKNREILKNANLSASLLIVKTQYPAMNLENIGCRGNTNLQLCNGKCTFKGLKFSTTSYNNEHSKFQIAIVITQVDAQENHRIICSRISSSVFVDSRKQARGMGSIKSIQQFIDPFLPENIDKQLYKRENRNNNTISVKIDKSVNGFINYYTAANIRHKIKHPIFLALRFSGVIKLYLNKKHINQGMSLVEQIQHHLVKKQESSSQKVVNILVELGSCDEYSQRKAMDILLSLENDQFNIISNKEFLNSDLQEISNLDKLISDYKTQYPNLIIGRYKHISITQQPITQLPSEKFIEPTPSKQICVQPTEEPVQHCLKFEDSVNLIKQEQVLSSKPQFQQEMYSEAQGVSYENLYQSSQQFIPQYVQWNQPQFNQFQYQQVQQFYAQQQLQNRWYQNMCTPYPYYINK